MAFAATASPPRSSTARLIDSMGGERKALLSRCKALPFSDKHCFNRQMPITARSTDELDLGSKIREVLKAAELTGPALVDAGIVKNRQAVNGWIATGRISKPSLAALAEHVRIPMDWWLIPKDVARPTAKQMLELAKTGAASAAARPAVMTPVVGEARLGVDGFYEETPYSSGSDGWVEYPARDGAYALRCKGDSMRPRIRPGEFVVVKPKKRVKEGDEVAVQTTDGRRMIKILNRQRDGSIELTSVNFTDQQPITLDDDEIVHMHYVAAVCKPDEYYPDVS